MIFFFEIKDSKDAVNQLEIRQNPKSSEPIRNDKIQKRKNNQTFFVAVMS